MVKNVTEDDKKVSWLARNWYVLVALAVSIYAVILLVVSMNNNASVIDEQNAKIVELEAKINDAKAQTKAMEDEALKEAVGLDTKRRESDEKTFNELMNAVATWSNGEEYNKGRKDAIEIFDIPKDSQFLTEYFPEQPSKTSRSGDTYYEVDLKGLNSKVDNIETSVIDINGGDYTYLSLVDISSESNDGKASVSNMSIIRYTIDANGKITDINGMITNNDISE